MRAKQRHFLHYSSFHRNPLSRRTLHMRRSRRPLLHRREAKNTPTFTRRSITGRGQVVALSSLAPLALPLGTRGLAFAESLSL